MMKKTLSFILALVLVFSLAPGAFAASGKVTAITKSISTNFTPSGLDSVQPGTVWEFPLTANMFTWTEGTGGANEPVTTAQLRSSNVTVRSTIDQSEILDDITIVNKASSVTNNQNTAHVRVVFVEDYASVNSVDFRLSIFLALGNNRSTDSRVVLDGTFENKEVSCNASTSYISLAKGEVLKPTAYNSNIEIDLGAGVQITTRVYANQKYYGVAKDVITVEDDKVVSKFSSIDHVLHLTTVNLSSSSSKTVSLSDYKNYYVYDTNGNYLGASSSPVAYSNRYFLSRTQIDMSGTDTSTGSGSGSTTGSSTTGSGTGTTTGTGTTGGTTATGTAVSTATAKSEMEKAVATAKANGASTATVRILNASSISAEALRTMASTASASNLSGKLVADTMSGNSVMGRVSLNPASASNLSGEIQLGANVGDSYVKNTRDKFTKWYKNDLVVVSLSQKGSYGMSVVVAAKVDVSNMSTTNLRFYSYSSSKNQYTEIKNPNYSIDSNKYLHFTTSLGDDIVITDGALARK